MITPITPDALKERSFQALIKEYLIAENGYVESFNNSYDKVYALDLDGLFAFLESTQPEEIEKLKDIYKTNYKNKIIENLVKELKRRSSLDVLKHGIRDHGTKLKLAYFKPPTDLNPDQYLLYQQNILSVTEELNYQEAKRIDLVIFLNGIPIITMELKNPLTGQTYKHAIKQYKETRSNKEQLFTFKERSIVNFAIDTDEVYMTTRLADDSTVFLPFNKGDGDNAGNPTVEGKLKTHYIWEDILKRDSILDIIHKFSYVEKIEETLEGGYTVTKENLIFPRYHQLDSVRKILHHVRNNGSGHNYLIQHSAGSGKTNSITWLSHRLASLHDKDNKIIFNTIIVVTDRKVLDKQLQDSIYQLEHKVGVVAKIDQDSAQLAEELEKGTKIIISTIQKFPFILDKISGLNNRRFAVVIDEAHSSTSGRSMMALKEALSLEEAEEIAKKEEAAEIDAEDKINAELERFTNRDHVSFFAFTATPKGTTLRLFGTRYEDGHYYPFHLYSMRQAIEEGFILDVLKNYMTYKMFYKVNKKIDEDPALPKAKGTKAVARLVSEHPHNIAQKTQVVVEHFRSHTMKKMGGEAKAMMVTPSRLHAVRYKLEFDRYIKEKGYSDIKTLVAFSGTVKDGVEYKESSMNNGIREDQLPTEFDKDESRILIVADKYQTGYDQPKLHTMYVDKKLAGVKAVQTLSRLNRTHPSKEDTFILDFVNDPEDIRQSFLPFYRVTYLENDIEPNDIYTVAREIYDTMVVAEDDVIYFSNLYYDKNYKNSLTAPMNNALDNTINRMKELSFSREETIDFRNKLRRFIDLYTLIIQVAPFVDADMHRLNIYSRFLIKKMEIASPGRVDITDKVMLEYYSLKKQAWEDISLGKEDKGEGLIINPGGGKADKEEKDLLSNIIEKLNERYGTDFADNEKLAIDQIRVSLMADEDLKQKAKVNSSEDFRHAFKTSFRENVVQAYDKNQVFYGRILQDDAFGEQLMDLIMLNIYSSFKEGPSAGVW